MFLNFGGKPTAERRRQFDELRARFAQAPAASRQATCVLAGRG
jgi:hypothetical protein